MRRQFERRFTPYLEIFKTAWENKDNLLYALRILNNGVCDGCALGTTGMKDWTIKGVHLCWIRLNLLRFNTMPPLDPTILKDISHLKNLSERELRKLGRISVPLIRKKGDAGFNEISWDSALDMIAKKIKNTDPKRLGFYVVSRGTVNETYYIAQKVARFLGTNNIDNSARICHAPSTVALKQTIGYSATTCSYKDIIGSDLLVFFGSDVANNQPVMMKYIHLAKKQGTKIAFVNPFREPGMEKYWVPSSIDSAIFGTKITDAFFQIKVGGDIAFINGVLKHLIANNWIDKNFIEQHTNGWNELVKELEKQNFEELEHYSGISKEKMLEFAKMYAGAKTAILIWSMGVTMHKYGVSNVKAITNLGLSRGMVGREKTGLMPIRGHSGVQGGAEVGAVPNQFPAGVPINEHNIKKFKELWGFDVPDHKGSFVVEMVDSAYRGELDVLYCVGSNLFGVLPDSNYVKKAIENIPLRVHNDIVINPQMFVEPKDTVIILPATTRYEMVGGNTETSTERRIIFNPEIPGPRISDARDEWRVLIDIAKRVKPEIASKIDFKSTSQIREEIASVVPFYNGIQNLNKKGDSFQYGGERLCENGKFNTEDGKAHFIPVTPPQKEITDGWFQLSTRRGKQFNSATFGNREALAGANRDNVIMSKIDMQSLNIKNGDTVLVKSETGELKRRALSGDIQSGTVMMYWPEANVLIRRGVTDPECGIPAYRDEVVKVIPLRI
jgi:molybdopterin-dependent oxidoreductase alpha subunit